MRNSASRGSFRRTKVQRRAAFVSTVLSHQAHVTRTFEGSVVTGRLVETKLEFGPSTLKRYALDSADGLVTLHLFMDDDSQSTLHALLGTFCEAVGTLRISPFSSCLNAWKIYEQDHA